MNNEVSEETEFFYDTKWALSIIGRNDFGNFKLSSDEYLALEILEETAKNYLKLIGE